MSVVGLLPAVGSEESRALRKRRVAFARELRDRMTPAEKALWGRLRKTRSGGFRWGHQRPKGNWIPDFYCHKPQLVVEVDGGYHKGQRQADARRDANFESIWGIKTLRFTNEVVLAQLDAVCDRILEECLFRTAY